MTRITFTQALRLAQSVDVMVHYEGGCVRLRVSKTAVRESGATKLYAETYAEGAPGVEELYVESDNGSTAWVLEEDLTLVLG